MQEVLHVLKWLRILKLLNSYFNVECMFCNKLLTFCASHTLVEDEFGFQTYYIPKPITTLV